MNTCASGNGRHTIQIDDEFAAELDYLLSPAAFATVFGVWPS